MKCIHKHTHIWLKNTFRIKSFNFRKTNMVFLLDSNQTSDSEYSIKSGARPKHVNTFTIRYLKLLTIPSED